MAAWTRDHERLACAWNHLALMHMRRGSSAMQRLVDWCSRRWGVYDVSKLTRAQCRHGCRQLNAWRYSLMTPAQRRAA